MWLTATAWLAVFFGAPWLGHGRRTEATLAAVSLLYGLLLLLVPAALWDSQATRELVWTPYGPTIGVPFISAGFLSAYGVTANVCSWSLSRSARFCGGLLGAWTWAWMIFRFVAVGSPLTFGSVCALVFLYNSISVMAMALANLPVPGASGAGVATLRA